MCRFAPEISADKEENRGNPDGFQDFLTQSSGNLWREAVCGDLISGSLAAGFSNEQAIADVFKWYGSKEKAMEAIMQSTGDVKEFKQEQDKNTEIYKKFMAAKETGDANVEKEAVEQLAENYKEMFKLDNARSILLDLASEYLQKQKLAEATDSQFGNGCSEYVAYAIKKYYGV